MRQTQTRQKASTGVISDEVFFTALHSIVYPKETVGGAQCFVEVLALDSIDNAVVGKGDSAVVTLLFITEHFFVVVIRVDIAFLHETFNAGFDLSPRAFIEEFIVYARDNTDVVRYRHREVHTLDSKGEAFSRADTTLTVEVFCGAVEDGLLVREDVLVSFALLRFFTVREHTVWKEVNEV
jgi:hypothetical protein